MSRSTAAENAVDPQNTWKLFVTQHNNDKSPKYCPCRPACRKIERGTSHVFLYVRRTRTPKISMAVQYENYWRIGFANVSYVQIPPSMYIDKTKSCPRTKSRPQTKKTKLYRCLCVQTARAPKFRLHAMMADKHHKKAVRRYPTCVFLTPMWKRFARNECNFANGKRSTHISAVCRAHDHEKYLPSYNTVLNTRNARKARRGNSDLLINVCCLHG